MTRRSVISSVERPEIGDDERWSGRGVHRTRSLTASSLGRIAPLAPGHPSRHSPRASSSKMRASFLGLWRGYTPHGDARNSHERTKQCGISETQCRAIPEGHGGATEIVNPCRMQSTAQFFPGLYSCSARDAFLLAYEAKVPGQKS